MPLSADSGFQDSEFDWDSLGNRPPSEEQPARMTGMDLLAWVVLVILIFCPPLGFAIALAWWR